MKKKFLVALALALALVVPAQANAHSLTVTGASKCLKDGRFNVTWTVTEDAHGSDPDLVTVLNSSRPVVPNGTVFSGSKSFAEAVGASQANSLISLAVTLRWADGHLADNSYEFRLPDKCPKPPVVVVNPRASFWGPCGDPFYRAVLDNRRSDRAVTFRVSYKPFGDPRRVIVRRVAAHKLFRTGLFDVAGRTRMTISTASGRVLASKLSAPNRVYRPCPTGVPVIR